MTEYDWVRKLYRQECIDDFTLSCLCDWLEEKGDSRVHKIRKCKITRTFPYADHPDWGYYEVTSACGNMSKYVFLEPSFIINPKDNIYYEPKAKQSAYEFLSKDIVAFLISNDG